MTSTTRRRGWVAWLLGVALACGGSDDHEDHDHGDHDHEHGDHGHEDEHDHDHGDHAHDEGHDDDHEHDGPEPVHVTVWSETLEVFVSHPVLGRNQAATLMAHFTRLADFRPAAGDLEATLDGTALEVRRRGPGVFSVALSERAAGRFSVNWTIDGESIETTHTVYPHPAAERQGEHHHDEDQIELEKERQWSVPFATAFAERREVRPTSEVTGELTTPPGGTALVHAPISGRVVAGSAGIPPPGEQVRAGQLLVSIAPTPSSPEDATRARLGVVDATARVEDARAELERQQRLLASNATPARRVAEAERRLRVAESALAAARQAQSLYTTAQTGRGRGGWRVTAPIGGVIDEVDCSPGETVDAAHRMFRIIDGSELWVRAEVPEGWAARLAADGDAAFQLLGDERWHRLVLGSDAPSARVVNVGRSVDARTRTVQVTYALLPGEGGLDPSLRVGAALRVAVPVGAPRRGVVVPRGAVLDAAGRSVVIVQVEGELFEERTVRLGPEAGDVVLIESGVEEGERVVTRGGGFVRIAARATETVGHGHVH